MTSPSFRDAVLISAYLDEQLPRQAAARLKSRLDRYESLRALLTDLQVSRTVLRRMPARRSPRRFTLKPGMKGIRPPLPRMVPVFSWASVAATFLFIFTLGANMIGSLSFGAVAPMMAAAPQAVEGYGVGGGPAETQAPASDQSLGTPTPEMNLLMAPGEEPPAESRTVQPAEKAAAQPTTPWLVIWLSLALVLLLAALLIRFINLQRFRHRQARENIHPE